MYIQKKDVTKPLYTHLAFGGAPVTLTIKQYIALGQYPSFWDVITAPKQKHYAG
jgi:hypothetical protein